MALLNDNKVSNSRRSIFRLQLRYLVGSAVLVFLSTAIATGLHFSTAVGSALFVGLTFGLFIFFPVFALFVLLQILLSYLINVEVRDKLRGLLAIGTALLMFSGVSVHYLCGQGPGVYYFNRLFAPLPEGYKLLAHGHEFSLIQGKSYIFVVQVPQEGFYAWLAQRGYTIPSSDEDVWRNEVMNADLRRIAHSSITIDHAFTWYKNRSNDYLDYVFYQSTNNLAVFLAVRK